MTPSELTLGVVSTANMENEKRAPIYPQHLAEIPSDLRRRMWFERGYGLRFGVPDEEIEALAAGMLDRAALFQQCDVVLLAKPTEEDFPSFRDGLIVWGWPHCVQGPAITQAAIDRRMTLIAWESMNQWLGDSVRGLHVFHKNNEIAGYTSVHHGTQLCGTTGLYGARKRAAVIHSGITARGALHALKGMGYTDLTCFTQMQDHELSAQIPGVDYRPLIRAESGPETLTLDADGARVPMGQALASYNVVANCIFQDTDRPMMFARTEDLPRFPRGALIVDVSCDRGLGFDFARPTSFEEPMFEAGSGVQYYAVDHSPSLLWRSATFEISRALLPYLPVVLGGPQAWATDDTIANAIEIRDGHVLNPKILRYQNRADDYPHERLD